MVNHQFSSAIAGSAYAMHGGTLIKILSSWAAQYLTCHDDLSNDFGDSSVWIRFFPSFYIVSDLECFKRGWRCADALSHGRR